jgi:hypothetical protein
MRSDGFWVASCSCAEIKKAGGQSDHVEADQGQPGKLVRHRRIERYLSGNKYINATKDSK